MMKLQKNVLIIGAGLAGLSAGIELQRRGIPTAIFEMAPWAGGVCTAWVRKGYTFDGCIHWMVGTRTNEPMRRLYESVGALDAQTPMYNAESITLEIDGVVETVPMDVDKFERYLLSISQEDKSVIRSICRNIKRVGKSMLVPGTPSTGKEWIDLLLHGSGFLSVMMRFLSRSVGDFTRAVRHPRLKAVLHHLMDPSMSMFALLMMLGTRMFQNGGYPMGGARDMIRRMTAKYEDLGGVLHLNRKVDEIVVRDNVVQGLVANGEFVKGTHVIAACDAHDTLKRLLKGKHPHPVLDRLLETAPLFQPLILISYGLKKQLGIPFSIVHQTAGEIAVGANERITSYHLRSFDFDASAAPEGKSSVMAMIPGNFAYWQALRIDDPVRYRVEKEAIATALAKEIDRKYPGFQANVEVVDVATPATYARLNNLYKGSYEGFLPDPKIMRTTISNTIDGIQNLYLIGQWTTPGGGIPPAIQSGIKIAKRIR